jgi:rfaE bifunctional protein kinase chain/domain/rfaE bifunctional protein nucleotidyltransferase chain/domain
VGNILEIHTLAERLKQLKDSQQKIVLCHGCFDFMHPGHIRYFQASKKMGDILVVTVTPDRFVDKGPGRPVFNEALRAESIAALSCVDYVAINAWQTAEETLRLLRPDTYVKGQEFEKLEDKTGKIQREAEVVKEIGAELRFTHEIVFSSTELINQNLFLDIYPEETKAFLNDFSRKHSFHSIVERIDHLKNMRVLLIGDGIIDEYHYCETMGKSPKSQIIVNKYLDHEVFSGGAFAIANHLAGICSEVCLLSLLGTEDSREQFVRDSLELNVRPKFFYRSDGPTTVKKRYINQYQKHKLFEVNFINDNHVAEDLEEGIIAYLKKEMPRFDLVLVSDFGHGLISQQIIQVIEQTAAKVAVNAQVNGANAGYNLITKYHRSYFICMDVPEARLATQDKHSDITSIGEKILSTTNADHLIITLGAGGSICLINGGESHHTPALSTKVIDIVGAGDAFFSYASLCLAQGMPVDLVSFIGNVVGAIAVQIVGNKRPVEKHEVIDFIRRLLG